MKSRIKFSLFFIIALAIIVFFVYILLAMAIKPLIIKQLKKISKKEVSLAGVRVMFPLELKIWNLEISNLVKIERIWIKPSILGIFSGNIFLNRIDVFNPEFTVVKGRPPAEVKRMDSLLIPQDPDTAGVLKGLNPHAAPKRHLGFVIKKIRIKNGTLNFVDYSVADSGLRITVKNLLFSLNNLYLIPKSAIANFRIEANIPWQGDGRTGSLFASGWINLYKKDMQADLKIEGIDGVYLEPYYSHWVDLEKARIQKATLSFESNIQGHNNDVVADCRLELTDLVFAPRPPEEPEKKAHKVAMAVLDIFRSLNQDKIGLNFRIRTKMDNPEFGFENIRAAFEKTVTAGAQQDKGVEKLVTLPGDIIKGTIKGATEVSGALIEGAAALGREVTGAIFDSFKKEKNKNNLL
jgi:hypothetical protein